MKILILLIALVVGAASQFSNLGNLAQISQQLKVALKDAKCEEKTVLVENFLAGNFDAITLKYKTPKPNFGEQAPYVLIFMKRIKAKTKNFNCQQKAELLDAALDMNMMKIRQLLETKTKKPQNLGNLGQIAKILKQAVKTLPCEGKAKVLKTLIKKDFKELQKLYNIPQPNYGNMKGLYENLIHLVENKYEKLPCNSKAQLLDFVLSGQFQQIRNMLRRDVPPGIEALKQLGMELQKATAHMTCQEKNEVFDSLLAGDWPDLHNLGIEKPKLGPAAEKLTPIVQSVAKQVKGMLCKDKAKIFDDLIKGQGEIAKQIYANFDQIKYFIEEVRRVTKDYPCAKINELVDLAIAGNYNYLAQKLNLPMPVQIPVQMPQNAKAFMEKLKDKMKNMACEAKAALAKEVLFGIPKDIEAKVGAKLPYIPK